MMDSTDIVGEEPDPTEGFYWQNSEGDTDTEDADESEEELDKGGPFLPKTKFRNKGGFLKFTSQETALVLGDEEENTRLMEAGFKNGLVPKVWEVSLLKGNTFRTWDEYNVALEEYEARSGYRFKRTKKKKNVARAVCRGWETQTKDGCKVEISARCLVKTGLITIGKVFLIHTCNQAIHKFRNGANKTKWVARTVYKNLRIDPHTAVKKVVDTMRSIHGTSIEPWTVQRARVACGERIAGGSKETFEKIPAYVDAIKVADPDGHAVYEIGEECRFSRVFIATASSMNAGKSCRLLVGLDETHTTGKYPMTLLFTTCFDAENHVIVLAWGLVSHENGDNWAWYLEQLRTAYPILQKAGVVFISDRDKNLHLGVQEVFPLCHHAHCVYHLRLNIKGNIDMACANYFKLIAEAKTKVEFEALLNDFQPSSERQYKFVDYVRKIVPELYARHVFPAPRYGHYTSNIVEVINEVVKPCRSMPALLLCDYIWCYCMEKHYERATHAKHLPESELELTQYADNTLNRLSKESQSVMERPSSDNESLMVDNNGTWVVRIDKHYCDCLDWQEFDFPCVHAIRWLANHDKNSRQYVGKVWLASTLRETYSVPIPAINIDKLQVLRDHPCLEPFCAPKKKGKKSTKRKSSWGEQQVRQNDRLVKKQNQKCGRCHRPGHNARSCMYLPPPQVALSLNAPSEGHDGTIDQVHTHGTSFEA